MEMTDKIAKIFLDRCLYYYDFDLVTGIVENDIIDKYGNNYTEQLGLASPCTFDELMERSYDKNYFDVFHVANDGVNVLNQTSLLRAYNAGKTMVEASIYLPKRDKYYRIEYYIVKDDFTGNPHVFVNCLDSTDEEYSRERIFGELQHEKVDIEDITESAQIGIWYIYLFDGQRPRMAGTAKMKELLGVKEEDISEEDLYDFWFSKVKKSSIPSVNDSVNEIISEGFSENEYCYLHPDRGELIVRCGGTSIKVEGKGYVLRGYHYDVTEIVRKDEMQKHQLRDALAELENTYEQQYAQLQQISALNELLRQQQESKNELHSVLETMAEIYYSLHVLDLVNDSFVEFYAQNHVKEITSYNKGAAATMFQIMSQATVDEHKDKAITFCDLETIPDRMKNKKILSCELIGKYTGWFVATFITLDADGEGRPTKVIFATRVIEEEKKQEEKLIIKTRTDELTGLYNRRAYEEDIYEHNDVPNREEFVYISLDVNGLKIINDTIGHIAGDEFIVGACECMNKVLGPYGKLYRIGGDEFVAIVFADREKLKSLLDEFDSAIDNWSGKLIKNISVSYGYASKQEYPEASVRELASIAEKRMYEAKSAHYRKKGVDRRGQQDAHKALCELYTKILGVNLTDDTYQIINMDINEQTKEKGFAETISEWLRAFGESGQVHPDDLDDYLRQTDLKYMSDYFKSKKTSLNIFYRRKYEDGFKQVMMEIIPANDYSDDNQTLFLYVKNIDK